MDWLSVWGEGHGPLGPHIRIRGGISAGKYKLFIAVIMRVYGAQTIVPAEERVISVFRVAPILVLRILVITVSNLVRGTHFVRN
jgi:hypothetical protein